LKKVLIVLILVFSHIYALDKDSTIKIYDEIIHSILHTQKPFVYVANKAYRDILKFSTNIVVSLDISKVTMAIVTTKRDINNIKKINQNIIFFATKEGLLFEDDTVVGAFYWKKGRSQLIFIKQRLDKYNIKLPKEYKKFIIKL